MKVLYPTCLVLLLTTSSSAQLVPPCRNFELPELSRDFIYQNYADAVLRVQSGEESGTGYLIDSTRGYVITAAHVVEASLKNPAVPITGTNPALNSKVYHLRHIRNLSSENIDIELLQLVPSGAMANVIPLDIALRPPRPSRPVYVFGFPRGERSLSQQSAEDVQGNENGTITVKQAAFAGDSGSPLIDETGKVIGTCIERVVTQEMHVSNEAIYVPVGSIQEILKKISISEKVRLLDNKIRNRETSREELSRDLVPTIRNISNVELYSWAWYLKFNPSPRIAATHFPCPIFRALNQRKLDDAVEFLAQTDAATKAGVLIAQGQKLEFFNKPEQASAKYSEAQALVAGLTNDPEASALQLTALEGLARVQSALGNAERARSFLRDAVDLSTKIGDRESQSDLLAQLARVDFERGDPQAIDHLQKAIDIQKNSDKSPILVATNTLVTQSRAEGFTQVPPRKRWFWIILGIALWVVVAGGSSILLHRLRIRRQSSGPASFERIIGKEFALDPEQPYGQGISLDVRYEGAWQETAARIQARDGILIVFVQLAVALIAVSLAEERLEYLGILVGYAALATAVLVAHHDLIIGKLGLYQNLLFRKYDKQGAWDSIEWFSKANLIYVVWARLARDAAQAAVIGAACLFGLWLSLHPGRVPQPLRTTWIWAWGASFASAVLALLVSCYVGFERWRYVGRLK